MVRVSQLARQYKISNVDLIQIARDKGIELQDATSAIRRSELKVLKKHLDKRFGIEDAKEKEEARKRAEQKEKEKKKAREEKEAKKEETSIEGIDLTKIVEETDLDAVRRKKKEEKKTVRKPDQKKKAGVEKEKEKGAEKEEKKAAPSPDKKVSAAEKTSSAPSKPSKKSFEKKLIEEAKKEKEKEEKKAHQKQIADKKKKKFRKQYFLEEDMEVRKYIAGTKIIKPRKKTAPRKPATKQKGEKKVSTLPPKKRELKYVENMTAKEIATQLKADVGEVIQKCVDMGEMINANQPVPQELAEIIAAELNAEFEVEKPKIEEYEEKLQTYLKHPSKEENLVIRAPVVTIMGHVDHGKTKLLDRVRKTDVARKEYGGITQHIGASMVQLEDGRKISFIDTPGHEDFTHMRARGAQVTDIAVLVVAADDGVKPQTEEAIDHIKAAGVKMVVAINKIDLPGASPDRVRQQLMQKNIIPDDLGGDTAFCEVSAITGDGIEDLLELIALEAEILELKADPTKKAFGYIIESEHSDKTGLSATVLIKDGTLSTSDFFICGTCFGKVKRMLDDKEKVVKKVRPGEVARVFGFDDMPEVGKTFVVHPDEKFLKDLVEERKSEEKRKSQQETRHISLEDLYEKMESEEQVQLDLIIKSDTQGTGQGILKALQELPSDKVRLNIIRDGVGVITEGDVDLADANDGMIIGFNVRIPAPVKQMADNQGVSIKTYRTIYDLKDDIVKAMEGRLKPTYEEQTLGEAEIRNIFKIKRKGKIAGCMVLSGLIKRNALARLYRDQQVIYEGKIENLKRLADDVTQVEKGYECGINLENFNDLKVGDIIEAYEKVEVSSTL